MSTIKNKTFPSAKAAVSNAKQLQAKGEISKSDLRRVESQVRGSPQKISDLGRPKR